MRWRRHLLLLLLCLTTHCSALTTRDVAVDVQMGLVVSLPGEARCFDGDWNEMLRVSRDQVAAHDYGQAIRSFQRAFECMDTAQTETAIVKLHGHDRAAFQLHYEYAELLRMRVLPRLSADDLQADAWKQDAIRHYQQALTALKDPRRPGGSDASRRLHIFNTIGLLLFELRDLDHALRYFQHAIAVDPTAVEPHGNTILVLSSLGDMQGALEYARRAQEVAPHDDPRLLHNIGMILYNLHRDHEAAGVWRRAMESKRFGLETPASLGMYYGEQGDCPKALLYLTQAMQMAAALNNSRRQPESYNALRVKLATAQLPMVYDSQAHIDQARVAYSKSLRELVLASESSSFRLPKDPVMTVGAGSMGYYAIYQGYNDAAIRSQLAGIYRNAMPQLSYTAPHVRRWRHKRYALQQLSDQLEPDMVILRRRIRVGFHSAFMRHHSVGILTQGVIKRLSRAKFEVVLLLDDYDLADHLTRDVVASADVVLRLSKDLAQAQQQISRVELDVLVFTEIGMHSRTYFLAFAQLALRTAMFWGHAVTSGIDSIDYFISSTLFHSPRRPDEAGWDGDDRKYTECVYRMQHLTAYVDPPPSLSPEFQSHAQRATFRSSLGLPSDGTMVLMPQTLYKLNPAIDPIIERILHDLHDGFLVLPTGAKPLLVDQLTARWRRSLSGQVYKRIFFVRALNETEFLALCATADIVLDSFPVGGGRSSLEIFSVGTPVVVHVTRTTILQLTAAMYRTMGINGTGLLAFSDHEYVENALQLARNTTLRQQLKQRILANKHKLFRNEAVVSEWETFLHNIMASKPPTRSSSRFDSVKNECPTSVTHQVNSTAQSTKNDDADIEFQMLVIPPAMDPLLNMHQSALVSLRKGQDPFQVAEGFGGQFEPPLELLQVAYVGKILWNARHRGSQVVAERWTMAIPESAIASTGLATRDFPVEIRYGDDLEPIIRWQILDAIRRQRNVSTVADWRYIARLKAVRSLIHEAITRAKLALPQFRTPQWRAVRAYSDPLIASKAPERAELESRVDAAEDCIALLVTTCKRLDLFMRTMLAMEVALSIKEPAGWSRWFCQLLIVDDNSSPEDRDTMTQRFPTFDFLFKTPEQRGHARSMQLGLARVASRYLLYLEDDWAAHDSLRAACQGVNPTACFLLEALAVLQHQCDEQVALVLLNDQQSGWAKSIITSDNRFVRFFVHEFAVADQAHSFAYWPGFSFNPGLWDLSTLRVGLRQHVTDRWLDTETDIFERVFALRVWRSGLRVAFAMGERFTHIGTNGSAYVLNGLPRRFEA